MANLIEQLDSFITDSKMLILLDPGHGGIVNNEYVTAPKKMYDHGNGFVVYEGVFNRNVVNNMKQMMRDACISFIDVVSSNNDVSLGERMRRANELNGLYKNDYKVLYLSIHGNAGGGTGLEIYTSEGETLSDKYGQIIAEQLIEMFPDEKFRQDTSDGDLDKESNFYVLRKTACPAVLTENFFFDRMKDAILMDSEKGQMAIAQAHMNAVHIFEGMGGF